MTTAATTAREALSSLLVKKVVPTPTPAAAATAALRQWPRVNKRLKECLRYKVVVRYDGAGFHGWQRQGGHAAATRTVQGTMEDLLRPVLRQHVRLFPAGRTDAGVSATGQVCQFDAVGDGRSPAELRRAMNAALPGDVQVVDLTSVDKKFATLHCRWKRYVYTIPNGPFATVGRFCRHVTLPRDDAAVTSPEELAVLLAQDVDVDLEAMRDAGRRLVGRHDFAAFQTKGGRATTVRTLYRCDVVEDDPNGKVRVVLEGDGFLYNMVRIVVGTLVEVGVGTRTSKDVTDVIRSRDRQRAGKTLAAAGLCLDHVEYDEDHPNAALINNTECT